MESDAIRQHLNRELAKLPGPLKARWQPTHWHPTGLP